MALTTPLHEGDDSSSEGADQSGDGPPETSTAHSRADHATPAGLELEVRGNRADDDHDEDDDETAAPSEASSLIGGAAAAGGIAGLLIGGPVVGVAAGAAIAYVAATNEGPAGNAARATGELAVATGETAKELNKKHHVLGRLKELWMKAWTNVRKLDEEHQASATVTLAAKDASAKVLAFERRHHVVENILDGIARGATIVAEKIRGGTTRTSNDENSGSSSEWDVILTDDHVARE